VELDLGGGGEVPSVPRRIRLQVAASASEISVVVE
jgi:hypothetical protein